MRADSARQRRGGRQEVWLGAALALFLVCLAAAAWAHHRYVLADAAYHNRLGLVTITPHNNPLIALEAGLRTAHRWLLVQAICTGAVLLATVNVLVQVVRRRNQRVAAVPADEEADEN